MYIKTAKPNKNSENTFESILNYIENLIEEISFNIDTLHAKTNRIQAVINEMRGEEK